MEQTKSEIKQNGKRLSFPVELLQTHLLIKEDEIHQIG